jgi:CDP-paratose synthetase
LNILITGYSGFVGSRLLRFVRKLDFIEHIFLLGRTKLNNDDPRLLFLDSSTENWHDQIENFKIDIFFHLAAYLSSKDDSQEINKMIDSNLSFGSLVLSRVKNIGLFVNFGTFAEFKDGNGQLAPSYYYAATKIAFRPILKYFSTINDFNYLNVIPYTIYDSEQNQRKIIDLLIASTNSTEPIKLSEGNQTLDFIHLNDLCDFLILIVNKHFNKTIPQLNCDVHLGTGKGTSIRGLAKLIEKETMQQTNIDWGAIPYRKLDTMHCIAPVSNLRTKWQWKHKIELEVGIAEKFKH